MRVERILGSVDVVDVLARDGFDEQLGVCELAADGFEPLQPGPVKHVDGPLDARIVADVDLLAFELDFGWNFPELAAEAARVQAQ